MKALTRIGGEALHVIVGGTFNVLHQGHIRLLEEAANCATFLHVAVTSDRMASGSRNVTVRPFVERVKDVSA
ncbi:MAG: adenylyltransferase/cytidyltransferase family protein, partial [Candidatus Thermoplasmatota archaeon]|nr:adenylyltransferase/cytidyltransferase family protein [Candidatus Thermoplasmatota archaeon]